MDGGSTIQKIGRSLLLDRLQPRVAFHRSIYLAAFSRSPLSERIKPEEPVSVKEVKIAWIYVLLVALPAIASVQEK